MSGSLPKKSSDSYDLLTNRSSDQRPLFFFLGIITEKSRRKQWGKGKEEQPPRGSGRGEDFAVQMLPGKVNPGKGYLQKLISLQNSNSVREVREIGWFRTTKRQAFIPRRNPKQMPSKGKMTRLLDIAEARGNNASSSKESQHIGN